tara:strand:- start:38 stop:460 length:423 start_codon:yes stop_codon:yes gene_type:complete
MPINDDEAEKKAYNKKYYQDNKEKLLKRSKEYRDNNQEKIKEYRNTGNGLIRRRIASWKSHGIISDDWDKTQEQFANTTNCEGCNKEFITTTNRCLDHNHNITDRPNVRNVLCQRCNTIRGYIDNDYQLIMKLMSISDTF